MPDLQGHLQAALAGRYVIERALGHGGMSVVFLAEDAKHHRRVALKVLRPELAQSLGAQRFVREIAIAARLAHPHILPLYDSGEVDGFLYYVMPYVEGESLRDRLEREHQLPLDDALQIAREVADALGHAHALGLVHRDIKPENILLQAGHAVVSDFGIARAVDAAAGDRVTSTGLAVGTPAYMSPEQAGGTETVDGRSDIYGLGCVLYEMLGGQPPFTGPNAQALIARHSLDPVPPLRTLRPAAPAHVVQAVETALAKVPADRFATPAAFVRALDPRGAQAGAARRSTTSPLRRLAGAAVAMTIAIVAVAGWWIVGRQRASRPAPGLAVLYFDNRTNDSSDLYLADGITEEIILRLGQVQRLSVKSGDAVRRFRAGTADPATVGRTLGVAHLVTGSVERAGSRLRVRVELLATRGGRHVWGKTYDRPDGDVLAIEDDIAQAVAGEVMGHLAPAERAALTARPTESREAYDHYLKGNFYLSRRTSERDGRRALEEYEAALRIDPRFASAYGRLGLVYGIYANWPWPYPGLTTDSLLARGLDAANHAITLDSANADGWLARGFLLIPTPRPPGYHGFSLDPQLLSGTGGSTCPVDVPDCPSQALRALARAIQLDPRNGEIWYQYGRAHAVVAMTGDRRHADAADSALRHSLALDPDRAVSAWLLGLVNAQRRRWRDAARFLDSAITLGRHDVSVHATRLEVDLELGDVGAARRDLDVIGALVRHRPPSDSSAAAFYAAMRVVVAARSGNTVGARRLLDSLLSRYPPERTHDRLIAISAAAALVAVGDRDRSIALLRRQPESALWFTLTDPLWDPIRADPRFQQLVHRARPAWARLLGEES